MKKTARIFVVAMALMCLFLAACGRVTAQDIVDQTKDEVAGMSNSQYNIELSARDDSTIVYTFTFLMDIESLGGKDAAAQLLEKGMASQRSVFTTLLTQMEDAGISSPKVVVEYVGQDGTMIYSETFQ